MISDDVMSNWSTEPPGHVTDIKAFIGTEWPAWTISLQDGSKGVAVPYCDGAKVNECFSSVSLRDEMPIGGESEQKLLVLSSFRCDHEFATLCADFVLPGVGGQQRRDLVANPVGWWNRWRYLLGNKNVESRVYDVLGELLVLRYLASSGVEGKWVGPSRATCDIDCGEQLYEVKSTLSRSSKTVTVHGLYQLNEDDRNRYMIFCRMEPSETGHSIDSVLADLVALGYNKAEMELSLDQLGYPSGKSARRKTFSLLEMTQYEIDDAFPKITGECFVGGKLPDGVTSISYSITLDGIHGVPLNTDNE